MKTMVWEPNDGALHGNQNYILLLSSALDHTDKVPNHQFLFLVPHKGILYWALKEQGANVVAAPSRNVLKKILWLSKQARINRIDAFLCMNERSALFMMIPSIFLGIPIFWYIKNMRTSFFLDMTLGAISSKILTISEEILKKKGRLFCKAFLSKSRTLPIGIPLNTFKKLGRTPKSDSTFKILMLSSVSPLKGVDEALASVSNLYDRGIDIHLTLAGAVPQGQETYAEKIRRQTQQYSFFSWVGWVKHRETLIEEAHLLILPSYSEGVPRSLVEAMASGRPVIATDVGGIKSLVKHGESGLLVDAGDTVNLTESILYLVENNDIRTKMGVNAANFATKHHDFGAHIENLGHILAGDRHN